MLPTQAKYMMAPDWAIRFWQPFCIVKSCLLFLLQIERREVESHLDSAVRHHLDMACVHLVSALGQINDLKAKVEALERREVSRGPRGNSFFWNTKPGSSRELFAHCETLTRTRECGTYYSGQFLVVIFCLTPDTEHLTMQTQNTLSHWLRYWNTVARQYYTWYEDKN